VPNQARRRRGGVADTRVGAELQQRMDGLRTSCLGGELDGGDALAVIWSAESAALVGVGAKLDQRPGCLDPAVGRRPGERSASVRVSLDGLGPFRGLEAALAARASLLKIRGASLVGSTGTVEPCWLCHGAEERTQHSRCTSCGSGPDRLRGR
jgi:hypothetical protein